MDFVQVDDASDQKTETLLAENESLKNFESPQPEKLEAIVKKKSGVIKSFKDFATDDRIKKKSDIYYGVKQDEDDAAAEELDLPWHKRTFRRLSPGSVRGSIFTLVSCSMGVGVLSLPFVFKLVGLVNGTIMFIVAGGVILWSFNNLMDASFATGITAYSDLITHFYGRVTPPLIYHLRMVVIVARSCFCEFVPSKERKSPL